MIVEHVVVAEHGEEAGVRREHVGERAEHGPVELLRIAAGIRMVAEEQQRVVRAIRTEPRDRGTRRVEAGARMTDVAGDRDAEAGRRIVVRVGHALSAARPSSA